MYPGLEHTTKSAEEANKSLTFLHNRNKPGMIRLAYQDHPYHFGFKKSKNGQLPSIQEEGFKGIVDRHGAVFLGDTSKKELYLTFDNGYENGFTASILDTLLVRKVPAIFFVTGHYVKEQLVGWGSVAGESCGCRSQLC